MVGRLAVGRWIGTAVAGGTLVGHRHLRVVPLGRLPAAGVVTAHAVHTGRNVRGRFTCCSTAIVATGAIGGTVEQAVVGFGAQPGAGGLMAALTHRLAVVDSGGGTRRRAKVAAQVAAGALGRDRHIGMELPRIPAGVAPLVAAIAVGDRHTTEGFVRNVVGRGAAGGREAAGVAGRTLVGHRSLRMVPPGRLPACGGVATDAVGAGRKVRGRLARGRTAVVAGHTIRSAGETTVVRFGAARPGAGRFVAVLAHTLAIVDGGRWPTRGPEAGAHVASCTLRGYGNIGVKLARIPAGVATLVAAVAIGNRHPCEGLVWNVVAGGATGRRKATGMTGRALVGHRHLAVVPVRRFPPRRRMAADAVQRRWQVRTHLTRCRAAVVATGTIGRTIEQAMVGLGARPGAGRFVAVLAHTLPVVDGCRRTRRGPEAGAHMAGRALVRHRYVGVELPLVPAGVAPFVATVTVGNGHAIE